MAGKFLSRERTSVPFFKSKLILAGILVCIGAVSGAAQVTVLPGAGIQGRVIDGAGKTIVGANVILRNLETGLERATTSDAEGVFTFSRVHSVSFEVTASARGFAASSKLIPLGTSAEIELVLDPAPLSAEVIVTSGSRQEELRESLDTKVDVIGQTEIRDTGYQTVGEILRELPGVMTRRGSETAGAAVEQVQGIDSRQVLVLQDGQPVVAARGIKSGNINLDRQSVTRLDRLEVVKGASSALYGSDAIGGVINLITREPTAPIEMSITTSGGSLGTFDAGGQMGFRRGKWTGLINLERHKNNGFDLTPTTFDTTGAAFHRTDAFGKVKYQFQPGFSLIASANSYWNNTRGRSVGETGNQIDNIDDESQAYGLVADWQINGRTSLQARGYFSRYDEITRSQRATAPFAELPGNLFERYGKLDVTVTRILGEHQLIQAGGEWTRDSYRGINRLRNDREYHADTAVFWAQDKISLNNRLTLTLGARVDHHSVFGSAVSPKAGVNVRVTDSVRLRASWGRGFRAPDLGQLYYRFLNPTSLYQVLGNPDLNPEHSGSWQAGGEYMTRDRRLRFGLNLFRNDIRNLINSKSLGFVASNAQVDAIFAREGLDPTLRPFVVLNRLLFVYDNLANIATKGIEADGDVRLPRGFGIRGAYTYLYAFDKQTNLYLTNRNRHQGQIRLSYDNIQHGFRANLRGSFYSKWIVSRAASGVETIAPGFPMWDVYAAKRIARGFEGFGTVDNLFDNRDPNTGKLSATNTPLSLSRFEVGRTFRVGIRWSFNRD